MRDGERAGGGLQSAQAGAPGQRGFLKDNQRNRGPLGISGVGNRQSLPVRSPCEIRQLEGRTGAQLEGIQKAGLAATEGRDSAAVGPH